MRRLCVLLGTLCAMGWAQDGPLFDPGAGMKQRAAGAPEALDRLRFLLGDWQVTETRTAEDGTTTTRNLVATYHYMNRGHAVMARTKAADPADGWASTAFLVATKTGEFGEGEADTARLNIRLANGGFEGDTLQLTDAARPLGGLKTLLRRIRYQPLKEGGFRREQAESQDLGATWQVRRVRVYSPSAKPSPLFAPTGAFGKPAADRHGEAAQNDFLIGDWTAAHHMVFPGGREARWQADTSAVYCLNGHAFLEFSAFDTDPSLPDAATSILRVFNPAMNRWEALYTANRFPGLLYFGGTLAGDRMVLTRFATDASDAALNHFVFYAIQKDSYRWYGETSTDGGRTYQKYWDIDITRKKPTTP